MEFEMMYSGLGVVSYMNSCLQDPPSTWFLFSSIAEYAASSVPGTTSMSLSTLMPLSTSTRMMLSFFTSFVIMLAFGKRFISFLLSAKMGQPIRDEQGFLLAELHKSKKNTPTMGGLLLAVSALISSLFWTDLSSPFIWILIAATVTFGAIGACDDWAKLKNKSSKGLPGKLRLILQTGFALSVLLFLWAPFADALRPVITLMGEKIEWYDWQKNLFLPFISHPIFISSIVGVLAIQLIQWCAIVGSANAVNLTDGLDGLASGCALFASAFLALFAFFTNNLGLSELHGISYIPGSGEIAIYLAAFFGAILGFLWFNAHPAQVFMGDTGSLAIGGTLGTSAVLLKAEWYLALVGMLFVFETFSVILQVLSFKLTGKRIFRCAPLHHHFEYMGIPETKVVARFWIAAFLLAVLGALSLKI